MLTLSTSAFLQSLHQILTFIKLLHRIMQHEVIRTLLNVSFRKSCFSSLVFFFFPLGGSSYIIQTKIMCSFINIFYIKIKFDSSGQTGNVDVWSSCRSDQMGHHFKHAVWLFFTEVLLDPCRTWCPSSSCQAVCQLNEAEVQLPQPVQCPQCSLRFCSACRADCHSGQACQESLPITTFLPGENGYLL